MCYRYTTTPKCRSGVCVSAGCSSYLCSSLNVEIQMSNGIRHLTFDIRHFLSCGSPESRTQHYAVISRVRATGPRLPFANVVIAPVGMARLELALSCSQSTRAAAALHPANFSPSVRTGGFEPPISWSPTRRDNQASPRSELQVGWAEFYESHHSRFKTLVVGLVSLGPPYFNSSSVARAGVEPASAP